MDSRISIPKIALSSRYSRDPDKLLKFARENNFHGIEYSVYEQSTEEFNNIKNSLIKLSGSELEIRYHLPFCKIELSHINKSFAKHSLNYMKYCIDNISGIGGKYIIVHLGLGYRDSLDKICCENAEKYLGELVEYAEAKNIIVCLENLTFGLVNSPDVFLNMIHKTGCKACVDIGHIIASPIIKKGELSALEYIDSILPYLEGAHIYDKEIRDPISGKYCHLHPENKNIISDRIKKLYDSKSCNWWLIELGDPKEILLTKSLLVDILNELNKRYQN